MRRGASAPPELPDDAAELSSEWQDGAGDDAPPPGRGRRLGPDGLVLLPRSTVLVPERRRLLRSFVLLFRFLELPLLALSRSFFLSFKVLRTIGGGLGGGPRGSIGGPDLSRPRRLGGGDRAGRFRGTENERDLDLGVGPRSAAGRLRDLGEQTEQDSSEQLETDRELGDTDVGFGLRALLGGEVRRAELLLSL